MVVYGQLGMVQGLTWKLSAEPILIGPPASDQRISFIPRLCIRRSSSGGSSGIGSGSGGCSSSSSSSTRSSSSRSSSSSSGHKNKQQRS